MTKKLLHSESDQDGVNEPRTEKIVRKTHHCSRKEARPTVICEPESSLKIYIYLYVRRGVLEKIFLNLVTL